MGAGLRIYTKKSHIANPNKKGKNSSLLKNFISYYSRMINFAEFLSRPGVSTIVSVILGFGLAAIFRPLCKGPDCLVLRGPPVSEIRGSVFQFGSKCVEFNAKAVECPSKDSKIPIVDTMSFAAVN